MTDSLSKQSKSALYIGLMLIILWLAAGVRLHNLGGQSLWYDEGVAFGHSQRTLAEMIPRLQNNVHVPAYFGSLAIYEDGVGSTEFGLRSYSVLWSLVSVAGVFALGKRLFHPMVGLSAALFVALNSFSIHYAQETRMYAMLAGVSVLSMWAFVRWAQLAFRHNRNTQWVWAWAGVFALINIVGEYTHVSYALVMLTQGAMAVLLLGTLAYRAYTDEETTWGQVGRAFLSYTVVNLVTVVAFAPWLLVAVSQISAQPNVSEVIPLGEAVRIIQGWFAFGITFDAGMGGMNVVAYFLLLFGLLTRTDERKNGVWMMLLPVVWVVLSTGLYLYLELYERYLRFLIPAQLAFALWMARGVWVLWSIVPERADKIAGWERQLRLFVPKIAAVLAVIAFGWQQAQILPPLYTDAPYVRDDYRGLVATIEAEADSDDAIILSAPGLQEIFDYYYDADIPVYPLPASEDITGDTQAVIDAHERVFVVWFGQSEQDSEGVVANTLNTQAYQMTSDWVGDVRFERYATPTDFAITEETNLMFGDAITLEAIALSSEMVAPNDALQVQLTWSTDTALDTRYRVFLQLLNSDGMLVAQRDSEPVANQALTTLWQPNAPVVDNHALLIPSDLPAGAYTLIVGLYDVNDASARLGVGEGDFYVLGEIVVE
ncbi:MAG: glycosyltransferase family 39 protein [Chloroflexota bacterium]